MEISDSTAGSILAPAFSVKKVNNQDQSGVSGAQQQSDNTEPAKSAAGSSIDDVNYAAVVMQQIVDGAVPETALNFSVERDISRVVVAVRVVGSDEIVQQFPPEEFIAVAKFIASQNPDVVDEDFLKGILFDTRS